MRKIRRMKGGEDDEEVEEWGEVEVSDKVNTV